MLNWIMDAASEIYHGGEHGEHRDTSPEVIASVILRHAPFKDGVAYMPVPRCETCAHWSHPRRDGKGECGEPWVMAVVPKTFGCVQWEEKS